MRQNVSFITLLAFTASIAFAEPGGLIRRGGGGSTELSTYYARPEMRDFLSQDFLRSSVDQMLRKSELEKFNIDRFGREYGKYTSLFGSGSGGGPVSIPQLGGSYARPATVATKLLERFGDDADLAKVKDFSELFGNGEKKGKATDDLTNLVVLGNTAIMAELPTIDGKTGKAEKQAPEVAKAYLAAAKDALTPGSPSFKAMLERAKELGEIDESGKAGPTSAQYALAAQLAVGEFMQLVGENAELLAKNGLDPAKQAWGMLEALKVGTVKDVTFFSRNLHAQIRTLREKEGKLPSKDSKGGGPNDHALVSTGGGNGGVARAGAPSAADAVRVLKGQQVLFEILADPKVKSPADVKDALAVRMLKNKGVLDPKKATKEQAAEVTKNLNDFCDKCTQTCKIPKGGAAGPVFKALLALAA